MSNPIHDMMESSVDKIRSMADSNTIVGQPIVTADGTTVIPISKVKFGFAGGGSEFTTKNSGADKPYGGGVGASATITPVAFLISKADSCRVLPIPVPATNSMDRVIELIPDLTERLIALFEDKAPEKAEKTEEN